jgi:hypothetical protein
VTYDAYDLLAADVEDGDLHPDDAKIFLASYLNKLIGSR